MVRINLLPKEEKVKKRIGLPSPGFKMPTGIENYIGIGLIVFVVIILSLIHIRQKKITVTLKTNIEESRSELKKLSEVVKLVKELDRKRKDLDARIEIIRSLNRGRFEKAMFLYKISSLIPVYCWLQQLSVSDQAVSIKGITFSNQVIAAFMRNLGGDRMFQNVELNNIEGKEVDKHSVMEFDLQTNLMSVGSPIITEEETGTEGSKSKKGKTK